MHADATQPRDPGRRAGRIGIAAGLGAAAIWGGMYVVSRYALDVIPPITLVLIRLIVGTAALGAIALASGAPPVRRRDLPFMALLGFVGLFVSMIAQFAGTRLSSAANGALITSATPAFMILFARPILGEPLTRGRLMALVLATAGVVVTSVVDPHGDPGSGTGGTSLLGNGLLVIAAITWALYSTLGRRAAGRYPVVVTTGCATAFGALFTGALVPFELAAVPVGAPSPLLWLAILYLGVVSTAGAFYLWNTSIALLGAALPAILFFAQPIVGGLLGALLLGEHLTPGFFAGGALIGLAVVIAARAQGHS